VSEQLSTAGLEASGTGNMKFMLNGAVTIGTMDGANVEIAEAVGMDNIFIFGEDAYGIERMEKDGSYDPRGIYEGDQRVRRVMDSLTNGVLPVKNGRQFYELAGSLLNVAGVRADRYFVLHDFASYAEVYGRMMSAYADARHWTRLAAANTVSAGCFFADRTIEEYNRLVWRLRSVGVDGVGACVGVPAGEPEGGAAL
jgi:starch phosphorylase